MGRITDKEFFNCSAEDLAIKLLGKIICYNNTKYMITVTEAYPANDCYNYAKVYGDSSFGHKCLLNNKNNQPGTCFITSDMIHILGSIDEHENLYNHILVRGGIKVENESLILEDPEMNFVVGKPALLCEKKLLLPTSKNFDLTTGERVCIENYIDVDKESIIKGRRIRLADNNDNDKDKEQYNIKYRFYFIPNEKYSREDEI